MTNATRRRSKADRQAVAGPPPVYTGGRYRPLSSADIDAIWDAARGMLTRIGLAGAPDWLSDTFVQAGGCRRADGRITFSTDQIERAISRAARQVTLPGFIENTGIEIGGGRVHIGTGGAAVQMLDAEAGTYRDSTLLDLYRLMRVVDGCSNVHYGVRPVVARDMATSRDLDINTAFACLKATGKPIGVAFADASHVAPVVDMFDLALGGHGNYRKQPFAMAIIVHVVPPLRFAPDGVEIMRAAIESGMPLQICSAGQAGATSPASLAGALAQGLAESLAGLMVVDAIRPGHPCIFALMPFISDLRTGAMSGGGGESALANAAAAQLLLHLGLPSTVSAGMTDSKIIDTQAGYEKGYTVALAAQAGADMINLSVGMLGSIMVASPEALVIDDEMCGAILRTVRGIEVTRDSLDLDVCENVVTGDGHYLGQEQTLELMRTEYLYPRLADRQSVADWTKAGRQSIWERAEQRVAEIMRQPATHLPARIEREIRDRFDIRLKSEEASV